MTEIPELIVNSEVVKISAVAILGGIGMKIIERFLNAKEFVNEHTTLRAELRTELNAVKEEVDLLRVEADKWRERYYEQIEINTKLEIEVAQLRLELEEYKDRISQEFLIPPSSGSRDDVE